MSSLLLLLTILKKPWKSSLFQLISDSNRLCWEGKMNTLIQVWGQAFTDRRKASKYLTDPGNPDSLPGCMSVHAVVSRNHLTGTLNGSSCEESVTSYPQTCIFGGAINWVPNFLQQFSMSSRLRHPEVRWLNRRTTGNGSDRWWDYMQEGRGHCHGTQGQLPFGPEASSLSQSTCCSRSTTHQVNGLHDCK